MIENRRAERVRSLLKAKISFNNRMTSFDCVVKNMSPHGAKVAIDASVSFPNEFELEIPMKQKTYRCQLRWRDKDAMGVEFMDEVDETQPGNAQYLQLAQENVRLKAAIMTLSRRLEDIGQDVPKFF